MVCILSVLIMEVLRSCLSEYAGVQTSRLSILRFGGAVQAYGG